MKFLNDTFIEKCHKKQIKQKEKIKINIKRETDIRKKKLSNKY